MCVGSSLGQEGKNAKSNERHRVDIGELWNVIGNFELGNCHEIGKVERGEGF